MHLPQALLEPVLELLVPGGWLHRDDFRDQATLHVSGMGRLAQQDGLRQMTCQRLEKREITVGEGSRLAPREQENASAPGGS